MAWATKYRGEFSDLRGMNWKIDIEEDAYAGSINTMQMAGSPLNIEHLSGGDDLLLSPIKGSTSTIQVISTTNFQYASLYSSENLKYRVSIYYISTLYWRGYLSCDYSEPYDDTPYTVSIVATDALGILKDVDYDDNGTYYDGRRYESQIVLDILGKIGFTEFKEFCNLYDTEMSSGTGDSPMDQCKIDVDVFKDMDCYTVLEEVLKKYNAIIRQTNGVFVIYRPTELDGATVYGRYFTAATTKTSVSITPAQLISHPTAVTNIKCYNGGRLMIQSPLKKFTGTQDFGYKDSWIENYKFPASSFTLSLVELVTHFDWDNWTNANNIETWPAGTNTKYGPEGILITGVSTGPSATDYLSHEFGAYAKVSATDTVQLSFEYAIENNTGGATNVDIWIQIRDKAGTRWLDIKDIDELQWQTSTNYVNWTESSVPIGQNDFQSFSRYVTGLPVVGPWEIRLYYPKVSVNLFFKNIKFIVTSDAIVNKKVYKSRLKRFAMRAVKVWVAIIAYPAYVYLNKKWKEYTIEQSITDNEEGLEYDYIVTNSIEAPEGSQSYLLGDVTTDKINIENILEQFMGSLAYCAPGSLTTAAADFVTDHAAEYSPGGVVVTSSTNHIILESSTAGVNFTGSTSITNLTGDLSGTVAYTVPNAVATAQVDIVHITGGTYGRVDITCEGVTRACNWDTNRYATEQAFAANAANIAAYAAAGIDLTYTGPNGTDGGITFTAQNAGTAYAFSTSAVLFNGDMTFTVSTYHAATDAVKRKDTITLTGSSGTANILCDGVTKDVDVTDTLTPTSSWATRGGSENKELIDLISTEIGAQYAREKHLIQMNIRETGTTAPDVNLTYNFKDTLNTYSGNTRVFVANKGSLDVYKREWVIDLIEIL